MKTTLLVLAVLTLAVGAAALAPTAAATCYIHEHEIDPVAKDTGTVVDKAVVTYDHPHCEPPPP